MWGPSTVVLGIGEQSDAPLIPQEHLNREKTPQNRHMELADIDGFPLQAGRGFQVPCGS